jgi:signal transduction histidine kinase
MKPAIFQQELLGSAEEQRWLEPLAIDLLVSNARNTHYYYLTGCLIVFSLLYFQADFLTWCFWSCLHLLLIAARIYFYRGYSKLADPQNPTAGVNYFNKHSYLFGIKGIIWGSTVFLFNPQAHSLLSVLYLLFTMAFAYSAVINYVSHYPTVRIFMVSYGLGLIVGFLMSGLLKDGPQVEHDYWVLMLGVLWLTLSLVKQGKRLNKTYVSSMLFQQKNLRLIESLTEEKQSVLNAVATKNRMIASTAHDMRQPVLALDLYANWLTQDIAMAAELSPKISTATRAVISIFDAMFDLAQIKEDQFVIHISDVNMSALLQELAEQYQFMAENKGLSFRTRFHHMHIKSDPLLLKRMIGNLISNAVKYTQTGGVLLSCRQKKQSLFIEVWDTGAGIPQNENDLIFEEFYKSSAFAGTNDGFGLGLSVVKQFSEKLGYLVHVKSIEGRGTRMSIEIPLISNKA